MCTCMLLVMLLSTIVAARKDDSLCAATQALTSNRWTNAELVEFWQAQTGRGARLYSSVNRPRLVAALYQAAPNVVPHAITVPKEPLTALMSLDAINNVDEKARSFEGDGELRLRWTDERLCFNSSQWIASSDKDCSCAESTQCKCVILRGEDLDNFTSWMWIPSSALKALEPRSDNGAGGPHSYSHQEQRIVISSDGTVTWRRRFVEFFPATFDETKMPFDQQALSIRIGKCCSHHTHWSQVLLLQC